jgi:hypothetical protein
MATVVCVSAVNALVLLMTTDFNGQSMTATKFRVKHLRQLYINQSKLLMTFFELPELWKLWGWAKLGTQNSLRRNSLNSNSNICHVGNAIEN